MAVKRIAPTAAYPKRSACNMSNVKEKMTEVILQSQTEDASYDEISRELAFERMIERGLEDSRNGRVISNEDMDHRIRSW